jgi:sulfatase modifying factor 1
MRPPQLAMKHASLLSTLAMGMVAVAGCAVDDGHLGMARPGSADAASAAGGEPVSPPSPAPPSSPTPPPPSGAVPEPDPASAPDAAAPVIAGQPDAALIIDAPPDAPSPIDLAPPSPDLAPDLAPPCPPSLGGPELVRAGDFCIDATEVTNAQYAAFWTARNGDLAGQIAACSWNRSFTPDSSGGARWPAPAAQAQRPVVNVDWCDAQAFCRWAGKRLCGRVGGGSFTRWEDAGSAANSQWASACTSGGRARFPYGDGFQAGACNSGKAPETAAILVDVGSQGGCRTGSGAYDLSGNVEEWVDACTGASGPADDCAVVGASALARVPDDLSCQGSPYPDRRSSTYELRGFRCCAP